MIKNADLISTILLEIRKAQTEEWTPPTGPKQRLSLPPVLWPGDGSAINATETLISAVSQYADKYYNNETYLKSSYKLDEFTKITKQCFGIILSDIDLSESDDVLNQIVRDGVDELLKAQVNQRHQQLDLSLGCHLFENNAVYPIVIGPVRFEAREAWRTRMLAAGKLSRTTARRLKASWENKSLGKRKPSNDSFAERAIAGAIGNCPIVCTVATAGLSGTYAQEKGLMAARLAMTTLSLVWLNPAEGLKWMKLLYDRQRPQRHTVLFGPDTNIGYNSERSELPSGKYVSNELALRIQSSQWLFDQAGEAIRAFVQPGHVSSRPNVMNALLLSLWWFQEGCREPQQQMATTMFAASMDALAGGKKSKGIRRLIGARLGFKDEDPMMTDGRTMRGVIEDIYDTGRSRLIHGSSVNFAHDWSRSRASAEAVGRLLLVASCEWFCQNPAIDDIKMLSNP